MTFILLATSGIVVMTMPMSAVESDSKTMVALAFHDSGSNVTMIRNELAKKPGLTGCEVKQKLVRSGGDVMDWKTTSYKVPLLNSDGKVIILTAMGMDEISSVIKPAKVDPALKVFPQIPDLQSIRRPSGLIDRPQLHGGAA